METLYQKTGAIRSLREYFSPYLNLLTKPSGAKLFLLLLAMITMQFTTSINHLFRWFMSDISDTSLNAYYYLLTYTEIALESFFMITAELAVSLIAKEMRNIPVFLIIDDTLQAKYGTRFACRQTMFDHTKRNGSQYLKGHCFVAMTICVPVSAGCEIRSLNIPIGFRLRGEGESKLVIASKMIDDVMTVLSDYQMVILLCDSWYPKSNIIETVNKHENLQLIANVRADTRLFDLPPAHIGKRGRPAEKGRQLDIHTDFQFICVGDYFVATKTVLTSLFGKLPIYLTVTTPNPLNYNAYRVFICTVMLEPLVKQFDGYEKRLSDSLTSQMQWTLPLFLYSYRWAIEVFFYEQKTFWSLGLYRLRSKTGIEKFVNFSSICYACMKMLPHMNTRFAFLLNKSPLFRKYHFGEAIRRELFLFHFASNSENVVYSDALLDDFGFFRSGKLL